MKYTYCIWDFNGTILDDVELGIYSVNILLEEQGLPAIKSKEEYREQFDFPIIDYYKKLGFDFEKSSYDILAERWVELYLSNLDKAPLFEGVLRALDFFEQKGISQTVLSASEQNMLNNQLEGLGISERFEEILGIDNIYGDSKLSVAKAWRKRHPEDRAIFIGDTVHDVETAKLLGADCFLIASGHQSYERLCLTDAKIFHSIGELIRHLSEIIAD